MKEETDKFLRWGTLIGGFALNQIDSLTIFFFKTFNNSSIPEGWSHLIDSFSPYKPYGVLCLLFIAGVLWIIHYKTNIQNLYRSLFCKSDVWIYDAAHFLVSGKWDEPQVVGYGNEIARLMREGTILHGAEMNVQTGIQQKFMLTPEDEAVVIRNTRLENVNKALEEIRLMGKENLPIWTLFDDSGKRRLIKSEYWINHKFEVINDLKQANSEDMKTISELESDRPFYHSLKTNKKHIEKIWPPAEKPRTLYGSVDFQKIRKQLK